MNISNTSFYTFSVNNCIYAEAFDNKAKQMYLFRYFINSDRVSLQKITKFDKVDFSKSRREKSVPNYITNFIINRIKEIYA